MKLGVASRAEISRPRGPAAGIFARGNSRATRARGFTLLEVMLAFVLLALAMGLLIGMLANGLHQVTRAENATEATLYAQSLLDPLGTLDPIAPGERSGYFAGERYRWQMQITPIADPAPRLPVLATPTTEVLTPPVLYRITLDVSWATGQAGQTVHFTTLRARTPPAGTGGTP